MNDHAHGPFLIESAAEKEARERAEDQRKDRRQRKLQLWFNGALMIATILTLGTLLYQNSILESERLSRRAWVTVRAAQITSGWPIAAGIKPVLSVEYQNTGLTPAIRAEAWASVAMGDDLPNDDEFPRKTVVDSIKVGLKPSRTVIGPSAPFFGSVETVDTTANGDHVAIVDGRKLLVIIGFIEYEDVFGRLHETTFCFRTNRGQTGPQLNACHKWNSAK